MQKVIIDADTGIDDALALLLAVKSGRLDILGVTTVCGNVPLEQATANTLKVLKLLGKEGEIPVIRGAALPLLREPRHETGVHGARGLGGALEEMEPGEAADGYAPDFIIEQARKHPGELSLILMTPLTNMALALRKEPELRSWIKELIIMGGVVSGPGNLTPVAEYNIFADPEAAKLVFHSGIPITLVGLDVTRKALLHESHVRQLAGTEAGEFVEMCTSHYIERYSRMNGVRACALHDPLAVGVAIDRSIVQTRKLFVDVETRSELCDGQTVCDFQNRLNRIPNVDVCLQVDEEQFLDMFVHYLKQ
ncbi:nucleoside hydrolase [Paenibacillus sp. GYB004]|jgi:purine nucleosidase|uniref:nucleoside hydrolase n=1 Tax=Paenibacillus sp. GYB004 TaxID=2994393 RepID=UPI002F9616D5